LCSWPSVPAQFLRAYLKIDLRIFGDKRGGNDFSSTQVGIALGRLLLGGAIHLAVCAFVTLCVVGSLSLLAAALEPTAQTSEARHGTGCKARHCVGNVKGGPTLAAQKSGR